MINESTTNTNTLYLFLKSRHKIASEENPFHRNYISQEHNPTNIIILEGLDTFNSTVAAYTTVTPTYSPTPSP